MIMEMNDRANVIWASWFSFVGHVKISVYLSSNAGYVWQFS